MKRVALILVVALIVVPFASHAGNGWGPKAAGCRVEPLLGELPAQHVGDRETSDLMFMREEEKLARDVYLTLHERWGLATFRQIARSESRHMALALAGIDKYDLEDPVGDNGLGVFTNRDLQALYEELAGSGVASVESALLVGAAIEDLDIRDLQRSLARADNEDLDLIYQNLMKGSRNHLRAFTRALQRFGVVYQPVYLSPEEYREIVDSPQQRGVVDANGEPLCGGGRR